VGGKEKITPNRKEKIDCQVGEQLNILIVIFPQPINSFALEE
jgi:hypothetical protein